jgi:hypothetical protein
LYAVKAVFAYPVFAPRFERTADGGRSAGKKAKKVKISKKTA